jgi:hypothetical protein
MRSEGTTLFVDGRLSHAIARDAWLAAERRIADLAAEGYADWALDPATGTLVARSRQTGGVKASITRGSGEMIEASYADFHFAPADLSRLATVLGAQQRGVNTIGLFRSVEGSWGLVTSSGEIRPFLAGAHAELATLEGLVNNPDAEETANSLADYLGDQLAEELRANFSRAWPEGMGADLSTAFFKTYPSAQVLYPQGIPADIQQVFQEMSSLRPLAEPIQTPYGWLLPGSGPYLLDAPPSAALALLLSRSLGANDIRMVAPSSTPLRVTAYLQEEARRQSRVTGKDMVVLFTPHSESSEEDASIERAEFEPLRRRLEQLGARVIDVGGDPTGHQQVLNELASQDLVIFDIGHSGLDGTMYVYQDGNVHPDQFVTARGVKYFMTCCSVHNGLAGAAVRSGADIAVGTTSPLTQRDVNIVLSALAGHLEQHGEGTLPSALDYLIRLRILHDQGGPTPASGILPVSFHNVPSIM